MKNTLSLTAVFVGFSCFATLVPAQENNVPPVVRQSNCTIDEGSTFDEVVARARNIRWDENSPNLVFFRRPIYTSAAYQDTWDLQIAMFFSSFTEMANRLVAQGDRGLDNLPIACGAAQVLRNFTAHRVDPAALTTPSAMTTSFCQLTDGSLPGAFNRISTIAQNYADAGHESLVQMYLPGLGGPRNSNIDFGITVVGTSRQALTEGLDLQLNGFRPELGNNSSAGFTCDRPSLWGTTRIYPAPN